MRVGGWEKKGQTEEQHYKQTEKKFPELACIKKDGGKTTTN